MNRLVVLLGTIHELQGAEKRSRNVSDPQYQPLLNELIAEHRLDFIFEEASGLGPTTAKRLADALGADRYLDVDPPFEERNTFGIPPTRTNQSVMLGSPFPDPSTIRFYDKVFYEVHEKREQVWIARIAQQEFNKSLMICGQNHILSIAFRLRAANFDVKAFSYAPEIRRFDPC